MQWLFVALVAVVILLAAVTVARAEVPEVGQIVPTKGYFCVEKEARDELLVHDLNGDQRAFQETLIKYNNEATPLGLPVCGAFEGYIKILEIDSEAFAEVNRKVYYRVTVQPLLSQFVFYTFVVLAEEGERI